MNLFLKPQDSHPRNTCRIKRLLRLYTTPQAIYSQWSSQFVTDLMDSNRHKAGVSQRLLWRVIKEGIYNRQTKLPSIGNKY